MDEGTVEALLAITGQAELALIQARNQYTASWKQLAASMNAAVPPSSQFRRISERNCSRLARILRIAAGEAPVASCCAPQRINSTTMGARSMPFAVRR